MKDSLYRTLYGRNPCYEILCTLVHISDVDIERYVEDAFIRNVKRDPVTNPMTLLRKDDQKLVMGKDDAYLTVVVYDPEKKFSPSPGSFGASIYFVKCEQDETDEGYFYLDYRIPKKFREALSTFGVWCSYKVGFRFEQMVEAFKDNRDHIDPLTNFHFTNYKHMEEALAEVLFTKKASLQLV